MVEERITQVKTPSGSGGYELMVLYRLGPELQVYLKLVPHGDNSRSR